MIVERFGGLDDGLVSRDRRAIREDRDGTEDPKVVSGSHQAKYLNQDVTSSGRCAEVIGYKKIANPWGNVSKHLLH